MYIYIHKYISITQVFGPLSDPSTIWQNTLQIIRSLGNRAVPSVHSWGKNQVELGEKNKKRRATNPSKIEWDRIPTDPFSKVTRAIKYPGFFVVRSVGPTVGNFLERNKPSDTFH